MKWILLTVLLLGQSVQASTFIGNGGQAGDVELAVSLKQVRSATIRIHSLLEKEPGLRWCVCPEDYSDHALCEVIEKLNEAQKLFCDKFIIKQLSKLDEAVLETQFEWVETSMLNKDKVGVRVVDAVAQRDSKKIYIDQSRFIDLTPSKRMFLLTHELFHMNTFETTTLNDEDKIGPFENEYGVRDLLNAAAAGIVLTSIDQNVFQSYSRHLNQSRSTKKHWFSLMSATQQVKDDKNTNFQTPLSQGYRVSYLFQPDSLYNFGFIIHRQTQNGEKTIFGTARITETHGSTALGISYRRFLFNTLDPLNQFWNTFLQLEILYGRLDAEFKIDDGYEPLSSKSTSVSPSARLSLYVPMSHGFWVNAGFEISQHKLYFSEFDYNLVQNSPSLFLGVTYGL